MLHNGGEWGFHLTKAYFGGRAYIMSILKNHTRAYFQVRSYFQGNRVFNVIKMTCQNYDILLI